MRGTLLALAVVLGGLSEALAQDNPPARLDTITLQSIIIFHRADTEHPTNNRALIWTSNGLGEVLIDGARLPPIWPIRTADGEMKPYSWFRLTAGSATTAWSGGYWFCEPADWDAYVLDQDLEKLKTKAWKFDYYITLHDYQLPTIEEPVTWEQRTPQLWVGYTPSNTLLVVRLQTNAWEWTIRGANGEDPWITAPDAATARSAAEAELKERGG